jgi:CheY-like chemotaxis protein
MRDTPAIWTPLCWAISQHDRSWLRKAGAVSHVIKKNRHYMSATLHPGGTDQRVHPRVPGPASSSLQHSGMLLMNDAPKGHVLLVENDRSMIRLIEECLAEAGYIVSALRDRARESVRATVERVRPHCVLLDGERPADFGSAWADAAWMAGLPTRIPAIMFTTNAAAVQEALANTSDRSRAADFVGVLMKPFDLDDLDRVVESAVSGFSHAAPQRAR